MHAMLPWVDSLCVLWIKVQQVLQELARFDLNGDRNVTEEEFLGGVTQP